MPLWSQRRNRRHLGFVTGAVQDEALVKDRYDKKPKCGSIRIGAAVHRRLPGDLVRVPGGYCWEVVSISTFFFIFFISAVGLATGDRQAGATPRRARVRAAARLH